MLSNRLMQSIEDHWEEIAAGTIRRIQEEDVPRMQKLPESELQRWAHGILKALRSWPPAGEDENLENQYKGLGRLRFEKSVPMYEVIRCLHILKLNIIEFARDHEFGQTPLAIYAHEEMEHRIGLFFDWLLYNIVRGYEEARRQAALMES